MTRLIAVLFIGVFLTPSELQRRNIDIPSAILTAYEYGYADAMYAHDDVGLVRITLEDIEEMI